MSRENRRKGEQTMNFKKNNPKTQAEEELNDISPVSDDRLESISGAGNPWEEVKGVPPKPIDEDLRDRA